MKIFGQIYFDLKPHEKFKIEEDTEHYYIKYYNRFKASHQKKGNEYFQDLAKARVSELDTENPGEIRAHTVCKDRSALENLLFSYYYLSDVRNETNHAMDSSDAFFDIMKESDSSERMDLIRQSIKYFLHCYDKVMQAMENKEPNVIKITYDDYADYVEELRNQARSVRR